MQDVTRLNRVVREMAYKVPKGERIWVRYFDAEHNEKFVLTSKELRDCYFLYRVSDSKLEKLGKAATPDVLEKKFGVENELKLAEEKPKRGRKKGVG